MRFSSLLLIGSLWTSASVAASGSPLAQGGGPGLQVVAVSPQPYLPAVTRPDIVVDFNRSLDTAVFSATPKSFTVFGENSGPMPGSLTFENSEARLRFVPERDFKAGEMVRVVLSNDIKGRLGAPLRAAGWAFEFSIAARTSRMEFHSAEGLLVRDDPSVRVRVYGGTAGDYDGDGWLDLALITEDADDLRMVMNRADGTCHLDFVETASLPLGTQPSPSSATDLDVDGVVDLVASNVLEGSVSIVMGNGDGTFAPATTLDVDDTPRGLTVLEANGDGLPDIVTANFLASGAGTMNVLLNDGAGGFTPAPSFDAGAAGEWAVMSADLDLDGILDLVVGARISQTVSVHLGNGDGTFTSHSNQPAGGLVWKLFLGDVNGDGWIDVTTANGVSNSASVLLNDGTGALGPATIYPMPQFTVASDLGDLDGDGDLDWVSSNFSGHEWQLWSNDGSGVFAFERSFPAVLNPACCIMMDADNDGDLDLVLLDELADVVQVQENAGRTETLFCFGDGSGSACPCAAEAGLPGRGCDNSAATGGVNLTGDNTAYVLGGGTGQAVFRATGFRPTSFPTAVLTRSQVNANGGLGNPFGDGLLCLDGDVVRLQSVKAADGAVSFNLTHLLGPGRWNYQVVYRDQSAFCTAGLFNTSNGVSIVWP